MLNFTNKEMQIKIKYDLCILTKMKRVDNTLCWWKLEFIRLSETQSLRGLTWHNSQGEIMRYPLKCSATIPFDP